MTWKAKCYPSELLLAEQFLYDLKHSEEHSDFYIAFSDPQYGLVDLDKCFGKTPKCQCGKC